MEIPQLERRRRLVRRHHLARTAPGAVEAVRGVAAFHSSDPVTPYLGLWARIADFTIDHLDRHLYEERTLWRMHAMRRTLFVVPVEDSSLFLTGASRAVARKERSRLEGWLGEQMPRAEVGAFLDRLAARVLEVTGEGGEWRTQELTAAIPELGGTIKVGTGKWAAEAPISSRLLFLLAMEGLLVRTRPAGSWRSSQYRWTAATRWWDRPPGSDGDEQEGRAALVARYLATHGPATTDDIRWWTGWTVRDTRAALAAMGARAVEVDSGQGWVLPDDLEPVDPPPFPTVALLPGLDPTPMGWKERGWYLGSHADVLFDRNGNVGPTVWADGRIVGGWAQGGDGRIRYRMTEEVDPETRARVEEEAEALTRWLDGDIVSVRFRSPLERELAGR